MTSTPRAKPVSESETKEAPKPQAIVESKSEAESAPRLGAKDQPVADLSAQIATRAYRLYEEGGRKDGAAVKNWERAESEVRKELAKAASAPKANVKPMSVGKVECKPEAKDTPQVVAKMGQQPESKAAPKSEIKLEPKTEAQATTASNVLPQLVKRVHELYETLGREEVRAVEDFERANTQQERPVK